MCKEAEKREEGGTSEKGPQEAMWALPGFALR